MPQYDENYERVIVSPVDQGKDKGVPQVFYIHNVLPTSSGFQSVGYDLEVTGLNGVTSFDNAYSLESSFANRALFVPAAGACYVLEDPSTGWIQPAGAPSGITAATLVTTAFVQGQTYICFAELGIFIYDPSTNTFELQPVTGLDIPSILGICAANGYLIAFTNNGIAWSNQSDVIDFVPSLVTGAGGGLVNDAKGNIIACLPISGGFVIYCENNAVGATYTGNTEFPFTILEIPGSGGVSGPTVVSWQGNSNSNTNFSFTNNGIHAITLGQVAQPTFMEVTEFIVGQIYEDFDDVALTWSVTDLAAPLNIKLALIANQYLVISYGPSTNPPSSMFTYALVYDVTRQRWGKLKINHVCAFQWNAPGNNKEYVYDTLPWTYDGIGSTTYEQLSAYPTGNGEELVGKTLSFLQCDGTVKVVNLTWDNPNSKGVLLLGKYQMSRNYCITHQRTVIEGVKEGQTFQYYVVPTLDGKTLLTPVPAVILSQGPKSITYGKRITGVNVSGLLVGSFNIVSFVINLNLAGQVNA